jgi:hypothetical protein
MEVRPKFVSLQRKMSGPLMLSAQLNLSSPRLQQVDLKLTNQSPQKKVSTMFRQMKQS